MKNIHEIKSMFTDAELETFRKIAFVSKKMLAGETLGTTNNRRQQKTPALSPGFSF